MVEWLVPVNGEAFINHPIFAQISGIISHLHFSQISQSFYTRSCVTDQQTSRFQSIHPLITPRCYIHWRWRFSSLDFQMSVCCFNRICVRIKYKREDMCMKELKWDCALFGFTRLKAIRRVHVTILAFQFPLRTKVYICMRHIKHWIWYPARQNFPANKYFRGINWEGICYTSNN